MTMPDEPALRSLRAAFDEEMEPAPEDQAMLDRAVQGTMASLAVGLIAASAATASASTTGSVAAVATRSGVLKMALPFLAGAAVSLAGGALYLSLRQVPAPAPGSVSAPPAAVVVPAPLAVPVEAPAQAEERALSVEDLPKMPASRVEPAPASAPVVLGESASDLFRSANTARRAGDVDGAVAGYRSLVAHYPAASESRAAHVSLGMLLLEKKADAAGALQQFDAYLAGGSRDTLAEEARLGRALAFQRLGRAVEERRAWHTLIENHPKSLHLSRAEARLAALGE